MSTTTTGKKLQECNRNQFGQFLKGHASWNKGKKFPNQYPPAEQRFWAAVQKSDGCWIWKNGKTDRGYGMFSVDGKNVYVHRFSYELAKGRVPDDLAIDHLCRNRACVNPDHLEAVTNAENLARSPIANTPNKTVCKNSHSLTGDNVYFRPDGTGRGCRRCKQESKKRWMERNQK